MSAFCSYKYHIFFEEQGMWAKLDRIAAILAFFATVVASFELTIFAQMVLWLEVIWTLYIYHVTPKIHSGGYDGYHLLWHIGVALGQGIVSFHLPSKGPSILLRNTLARILVVK
mmetsp:Transcript_4378/g.5820  ORF Transcript_4378/g.5820 Transcript_4378/m.5820 type:complete len:114 (-) Transcript_4378:143-484(-)